MERTEVIFLFSQTALRARQQIATRRKIIPLFEPCSKRLKFQENWDLNQGIIFWGGKTPENVTK